ncbi:hypothetical protein OE88DRAFT_1469992 [Heliocybe sulcata]|uniref:Peptidase A1 domain-containing protein n=1 Tax=Heliocybe sulcata TaxID=5364 RepID=A0A5C3N3Y5_9AGAM|nr:hypothetical protein OE88DRAFT_1469992 [Heliocybe sulcata]
MMMRMIGFSLNFLVWTHALGCCFLDPLVLRTSYALPHKHKSERYNMMSSAVANPLNFSVTASGDNQYTTQLTLGGQEYTVLLDLNSADLWLRSPSGTLNTKDTTSMPLDMSSGGVSVNGTIAFANVELGGYTVQSQALLNVPSSSKSPFQSDSISGVLGLGFPDQSPLEAALRETRGNMTTDGRTVLHNIFSQNPSLGHFFTLLMGRKEDPASFSTFSIGEFIQQYSGISSTPRLSASLTSGQWSIMLNGLSDGILVNGHFMSMNQMHSTFPKSRRRLAERATNAKPKTTPHTTPRPIPTVQPAPAEAVPAVKYGGLPSTKVEPMHTILGTTARTASISPSTTVEPTVVPQPSESAASPSSIKPSLNTKSAMSQPKALMPSKTTHGINSGPTFHLAYLPKAALSSIDAQIKVPKSAVDFIYKTIPGAVYDTSSQRYIIPCNGTANVTFRTGGRDFPIHPLDLSQVMVLNNNATYCVSEIIPKAAADSTAFDFLLGLPFLRNAYIALNYGSFDEQDNFVNPFIQLSSVTDQAKAIQEFALLRGQKLKSMPAEISPADAIARLHPQTQTSKPVPSVAIDDKQQDDVAKKMSSYGRSIFGLTIVDMLVWGMLCGIVGVAAYRRLRSEKEETDDTASIIMPFPPSMLPGTEKMRAEDSSREAEHHD